MDDKQIDDIVSMIDQFMAGSGGHMNITMETDRNTNSKELTLKTVTQMKSSDCAGGNLACSVPTLFQGLDTAEDPDSNINKQTKGGNEHGKH